MNISLKPNGPWATRCCFAGWYHICFVAVVAWTSGVVGTARLDVDSWLQLHVQHGVVVVVAHNSKRTQHRDQGLIDRVRRGKRSRASINDSPCSKQPQNRHCLRSRSSGHSSSGSTLQCTALKTVGVEKAINHHTTRHDKEDGEEEVHWPLEITNWEKMMGDIFSADCSMQIAATTWNTFVINYWFLGIAKSFCCIEKGIREGVTIVLRHRQLINNKIKLLLLKMDIQYMNLWWWSLAALFLL